MIVTIVGGLFEQSAGFWQHLASVASAIAVYAQQRAQRCRVQPPPVDELIGRLRHPVRWTLRHPVRAIRRRLRAAGHRATIPHVMSEYVPQRPYWNRPPVRLPDAFRLTKQKNDRVLSAVCELWSHEFGYELRLMIDGHGLQMSSFVRTGAEMVQTVDTWRAAMLERGLELNAILAAVVR